MIKKLTPIWALLFACNCLAQNREIVFTRTTKNDGLSATRLNDIIRDHQGYYWFSSINGLQRYDGHRMVHFLNVPRDTNSLPDNNVTGLMEDKSHRLWLNAGGTICIYQPLSRNFKKIPAEGNRKFDSDHTPFYQDSHNTIWISNREHGLYYYDSLAKIIRPYNKKWPAYFNKIFGLAEVANTGHYWLSTEKGMLLYDPIKKTYYSATNNPLGLRCFKDSIFSQTKSVLYLDHRNVLWTLGWMSSRGFAPYRYDLNKDELRLVENTELLRGFFTDKSGTTWAYGEIFSTYDYNLNRFVAIPKKRNNLYGIDFNEIHNMYEDGESNLWVISDVGLYNFNLRKQFFSTITNVWSYRRKKTGDPNTTGLIETKDGHIIATGWSDDGLLFYDSNFNQVSPLYGFNPNQIKDGNYLMTWCGLTDSEGKIWIGAQHGRIMILDPATNKVTFKHPAEFANHTIRTMSEDKYGNIWFGTQHTNVVKWDRSSKTFKQVIVEKDLERPLHWVLNIVPVNDDLFIGSTTDGLVKLDMITGKITQHFRYDPRSNNGISDNLILSINQVSNDSLAIVTRKGIDLFSISKNTFTHFSQKDGIPAEMAISSLVDDRGYLWFTTGDGISKIHLKDKHVYSYGEDDGITENDFQFCAMLKLRNGKMLFGNTRGYVHFDPASVTSNAEPAEPIISGFRISNRELSVDSLLNSGNTIRLKNFQNHISIQFASLRDIVHNKPVYSYMLEGLNANWTTTNNAEAVFSYLPPGNYTFKVRSISPEGIASANTTSINFRIAPAFYQAWWFYTLVLVFILSIIYLFYQLRINKILAVEKIRSKVARDLHDDMGSTLSTINILSSMAKTKMTDDPLRTSEYISKISDNSQRMMEAMDDIVWSIRPMNDSMQKITSRMREFATGILEAKGIELEFSVDEEVMSVKLNMEARRDFFLVFKEAVNNVAKYSHCSKCLIHVAFCRQRLLLKVQDNGIGFDVNKADNGNGLSNIQKRGESLKGRVTVQSQPGKGTQVLLNIPVQ